MFQDKKHVIHVMEQVLNLEQILLNVMYVEEQVLLLKYKILYLDKCRLEEHVQHVMEQVR